MRMDSKFDSAFTSKNATGKLAQSLVIVLAWSVVAFSGFQIENSSLAQEPNTTSDPRQTPAPWRPAFGPLNKDAAQGDNSNAPNGVANQNTNGFTEGTSGQGLRPGSTGSSDDAANNTRQRFDLAPNNLNGAGPANSNQLRAPNNSTSTDNDATTPQPDQTFAADQIREPGVTRVTKTLEKLPNSAGQVWREYDISPYTSRVKTTADPQKSITEWILRETGTEMWFHQPLGILNAEKNRLLVYHTPEIHGIVKGIVDRFNRTRGQVQNIDVNLVTVENPNWRAQSYTMLQPIEVNSPGVEAWMISKENAAILLGQLNRRGDFKQHSGGRIANHDGQSFVLEKTRPVQFVRSLRWVPNQVPNYQPQMTKVDEGYRLELSCLSALDNQTIEAVIKCEVDQVEKLNNVKVSVPAPGGGAQQMNLQIPQLVSWRLHERFRWPNDQVLLLSCGVVATPEPQTGGGLKIPGFSAKSKRADALLFVEYRGPAEGPMVPQTADRLAPIRQR